MPRLQRLNHSYDKVLFRHVAPTLTYAAHTRPRRKLRDALWPLRKELPGVHQYQRLASQRCRHRNAHHRFSEAAGQDEQCAAAGAQTAQRRAVRRHLVPHPCLHTPRKDAAAVHGEPQRAYVSVRRPKEREAQELGDAPVSRGVYVS